MTNHHNFNRPLDNLEINPDYNPEFHRGLSRQELFVLGWFVSHPQGRTYQDLIRDCKMTMEQIHTAIVDLLQLGVLRRR